MEPSASLILDVLDLVAKATTTNIKSLKRLLQTNTASLIKPWVFCESTFTKMETWPPKDSLKFER